MSMRVLIGVLVGMLCIGVVSADITITLNPATVNVPIGEYNQSIINVTVDSSGNYTLYFQVGSSSKDIVSANLSGPYTTYPDPWAITSTSFADSGSVSWSAPSEGTYYFVLNITTDPNANVGQCYAIATVAIDNGRIAIDVVQGTVVPELITPVLVGVGLALLILWKRRS